MKQKELLEKLEGEPKDSGDQIRLIKKFFSYMTGKNIRKLGGKMKFYYLKIILFLFFINIAHAASDNLTIPNSFSTGEVVSASKINANFDAIKNKVNKLNLGKSIFFPDGFIGTPVITGSEYTVASGKTLYILAYYEHVSIDNIKCGKKFDNDASKDIAVPIIVPAGKTVIPSTSFNGFIIDSSFEAFHTNLSSNATYTVANNKILVINTFFNNASAYTEITVNNIKLFDSQYYINKLPLMIPSGSTVTNSQSSETMCITGYFIPTD